MEETLQFLIVVDTDYDDRNLLDLILAKFPDAVKLKSQSCDLRGNWIEIWKNEDADPKLADEEDGFLYYRWRVEATPMKDDVTEPTQVRLARDLLSCFKAAGCKAVVCANFENQI